jgi:CheY-like chemotaxis protein
LAREVPDAIILDLRMPNVDGWEVLASLKARPELHGIPLLITTAETTVPAGLAVLVKPVKLDAVAEWLAAVLVATAEKRGSAG